MDLAVMGPDVIHRAAAPLRPSLQQGLRQHPSPGSTHRASLRLLSPLAHPRCPLRIGSVRAPPPWAGLPVGLSESRLMAYRASCLVPVPLQLVPAPAPALELVLTPVLGLGWCQGSLQHQRESKFWRQRWGPHQQQPPPARRGAEAGRVYPRAALTGVPESAEKEEERVGSDPSYEGKGQEEGWERGRGRGHTGTGASGTLERKAARARGRGRRGRGEVLVSSR